MSDTKYRELGPNERICAGDEWFHDGKWSKIDLNWVDWTTKGLRLAHSPRRPISGQSANDKPPIESVAGIPESLPVKYYGRVAGKYICTCTRCNLGFIGDKRDFVCQECELKALHSELERAKVDRNLATIEVRRELIPKLEELQLSKSAVEIERDHWKGLFKQALNHAAHLELRPGREASCPNCCEATKFLEIHENEL